MSGSFRNTDTRKQAKLSKADAKTLLSALVSSDEETRKAARYRSLELGASVVPFLIKATRSSDGNLRWEAIDSLGSIRDFRATSAAIERVLLDDDVHVRWRSIWAITSLDDGSVVPALLKALKSEDSTTAWNAAVALSVFNRVEAVPTLLAGLKSQDSFRRWEAVSCLGTVPNDETIPALISVLKQDSPDIRWEAALSLGRIKHERATEALLKAVAEDKEPQVRWRAAMALGWVGEPGIVPKLQKLMENEAHAAVREHILETINGYSLYGGFVATPEDVIGELLTFAGVRQNEVIYDLGSGDARVLLIAAKEFGARGVGIELQRGLVEESRKNLKEAGLTNRIKIIHSDIRKVNVSNANIVFMYLAPASHSEIGLKLVKDLRKGARIVTHTFDIPQWSPVKQAEYQSVSGRVIRAYLYIQSKSRRRAVSVARSRTTRTSVHRSTG